MAASKAPRIRLLHIRDEIDGVTAALRETTYEEYRRSYVLKRSTERAIQIISEAAKALPEEILARYPTAPWSAIIGIGNVLRHEYQSIDDRRLWDIATVRLTELRAVIVAMLDDQDAGL